MIGTLAWKEYREQRPVWLAMAVLGIVLLVGLLPILGPLKVHSPNDPAEGLGGIAVAVALTYGLVCGAMMLGGERESRTLTFLDYLEGRRAQLWNTKVLTGAILTVAQALVLAALATGLGTSPPKGGFPGGWFVIAAVLGLGGLAWGLLGSALCNNVLAAVGTAAGLLFFAAPLVMVSARFISGNHDPDIALIVEVATLSMAALAGSGLIFCSPDRKRRSGVAKSAGLTHGPVASSRWAILWLTYRQGWVATLLMGAFALVMGAGVPSSPLLLWPVVTLLLGVGCGLAVFAGEQAGEAQRFLGDQRLPIGRIWVVKTICWLVVAVALAALTFWITSLQVPAAARAGRANVGPEMLRHIGFRIFLILGLAYGFGFGQFFGLLTRKIAVALVLGVLVGGIVTALWVPSLISGGVQLWQVLVVPAVLVACIRPVLGAWTGGRLYTLRPVLALAGGGALAVAWMAGNFWYRAVAIPDVGEPFDVRAFTASLPTPEQNKAGRLIRLAAESLQDYEKEVMAKLEPPANPLVVAPHLRDQVAARDEPGAPGPQTEPPRPSIEHIDSVWQKGWPKNRPDLGQWLDRMFAGEWAGQFREAARMPLGMVLDLRTGTLDTPLYSAEPCRRAAALFTVRALQLQAQGNPKAALDHLGVVLSLSRQLRNKAPSFPYQLGDGVQWMALSGIDHWLRDLGPRSELWAALTELNRHEAQLPPFTDCPKADYLLVQNGRENLTSFLANTRAFRTHRSRELAIFAVASKVPWEEERETRLLRVLGMNAVREAEVPLWEEPAPLDLAAGLRPSKTNKGNLPIYVEWTYGIYSLSSLKAMRQAEAQSLCRLRGSRLAIALALYEVQKGRPAATLNALVPGYLPSLPLDPYSGQSFHYRISKGEQIEKEAAGPEGEQVVMKVPPGQGILWSVGPDHTDNGGKRDGSRIGSDRALWSAASLDWIFLVPRWEEKGRANPK